MKAGAVEADVRPPPSPSAASVDESQNDEEQDGADGRGDDCRDDAGPEMNAEPRQQPVADEGTDDADSEVGDETEAGPPDHLSGEPARDQPHQQDDEQTLT
jgi:hypothetical protein